VHFISIKPVLSDHLSYVTIFHCSIARSHKTGLTVYTISGQKRDSQAQLYCDISYFRSGVNQIWILKNSKDLLEYRKYTIQVPLFLR